MRQETKIEFYATEKTRKLAQQALDIQDACNPIAVLSFLLEVEKYYRVMPEENSRSLSGSDVAHQHPVSLCVLNKLNDLASFCQTTSTHCFEHAAELASGNNVQATIYVLV